MIKTVMNPVKNAWRWNWNATNTWMVLADTTAWSNEESPPAETATTLDLTGKYCAVKATILWVTPNDSGTITYIGSNGQTQMYSQLTTLSAVEAAQPNANVLITAQVTGNQLASLNGNAAPVLHQVGVYTDLVPATGYTSNTFLTPAQVSSWGDLEAYENRTPLSLPLNDSFYVVQVMIQYGAS